MVEGDAVARAVYEDGGQVKGRGNTWKHAPKKAVLSGGLAGWDPLAGTAYGSEIPHTWLYPDIGLWLDAGKTLPALLDGDAVYTQENQGSDVSDFVQAVAGSRPLLKHNVVNGCSVLRYDGSDWLRGAFAGALTQPFTVFAVAQLAASEINDNDYHEIMDGNDVNRFSMFQNAGTTPDRWGIYGGATLTGNVTTANWFIWTVIGNGGASAFYLNGVLENSGAAGANNPNGLTIGASNTGASDWIGDIAELLIYDVLLSTADLNEVGMALAAKYDLAYTVIV
jgi:hypothetical protein